jgi:hypothetical protein
MKALTRGLQRGGEAALTAFLMFFSLALLWPVALLRRKYLLH